MATAAKTAPKAAAPKTLAQATDLIRAMWYSDPGKGKTYDMAHMAKLGKVIYVDAEKRLKKGVLQRAGIPLDNIEPHTEISYKGLLDLAQTVRERLDDGEQIVGVVWDSATEIHRLLLEDLVDRAVVQADRAGKDRDSWKTYQEDYGDMTEQMRRLIRRWRDLPIHFAMSCLAKRDNDEEGAIRVSPALTPAVQRDFLGYMDIVIHKRVELVNGVEEYSGLTRPVGRFEAKDAFGVLPRVLVNPSFDRLLGYVEGDLTSAKDPVQQAAKAARGKATAADKNSEAATTQTDE